MFFFNYIGKTIAGKTRPNYRPQNAHERRTPELGQGLQTGAGPEKGQSYRVLLWPTAAGQNVELQM